MKEHQWQVAQLGADNLAEAASLLPALSANEFAAIQISQFLSSDELETVIKNLSKQTIQWYPNKENQQGRIGISTTEYHFKEDGKKMYFDLAPQASRVRDEIFESVRNPIKRIIELFAHSYITSIATEPDLQNAQYFAGLIRAMGAKSTLHFDYAPNQLPGWSVSDSDEQFGLVLYLQMVAQGGGLTVYNRPWKHEDEEHNKDVGQKGTYGFTEDFIKETPHATVTPSAGDLVVFRSRNFHQVEAIESNKPRLAMNTFMTLKDGALSLWT